MSEAAKPFVPDAVVYRVTVDGKERVIALWQSAAGLCASIDGRELKIEAHSPLGAQVQRVEIDGELLVCGWHKSGGAAEVVIEGAGYAATVKDERARKYARLVRRATQRHGGIVKAPMPGLIASISVSEGAQVKKGQSLLTLNAMKLENDIRAPFDGVVKTVQVKVGQSVDKAAVLVVLA